MKKLLVVLGLPLVSVAAHADICAYTPDMDMGKIDAAIQGLTVSPEPIEDPTFSPDAPPKTGKVIGIFTSQTDDTSFDLQMSDTGVYDATEQTFFGADLGHFNLLCTDAKGEAVIANLAGALKNSGIMCATPQFAGNIPDSPVDLGCKPVSGK